MDVLAVRNITLDPATSMVGGPQKEMAVYLAPGEMDERRADPPDTSPSESEPRTK